MSTRIYHLIFIPRNLEKKGGDIGSNRLLCQCDKTYEGIVSLLYGVG